MRKLIEGFTAKGRTTRALDRALRESKKLLARGVKCRTISFTKVRSGFLLQGSFTDGTVVKVLVHSKAYDLSQDICRLKVALGLVDTLEGGVKRKRARMQEHYGNELKELMRSRRGTRLSFLPDGSTRLD